MAVQEHSVGPFYFATVVTNKQWVPPHLGNPVEMEEPWRQGVAVILPFRPWRALVLGLWRKTLHEDVDEDFADDIWFDPSWLESEPSEIATWYSPEEELVE